ncbi:hypothetical protein Ciccas_004164 [Cichlidogyrus casuarinus]|uniref:Uncharacterized protein n=1 Tax=Cichlidogyrus casuarinus TaxID=1844966 RepID=A0ABD2QCR7_9PLAT
MEIDEIVPSGYSHDGGFRVSRRDRHQHNHKTIPQANAPDPINEPVISFKSASRSDIFHLVKKETRGFSNPYITNVSCDAQCEFEDFVSSKESFSLQAAPSTIELEIKILPMVKDPIQNEVRIPISTISPEKLSILKNIAKENNLSLMNFNKDSDAYYVLRKKAKTQNDQVKEIESKLQAIAKSKSLYCTPVLNGAKPMMSSFCCQADVDKETAYTQKLSKKAYRREKARKRAEKQSRAIDALESLKNKPIIKVETEMQTAAQDSWVCPWCGQDIIHDQLIGHEAMCKSQFNYLKNELRRKRKTRSVPKSVEEFPKNHATRVLCQELDRLKDPNDVNTLIEISSKLCNVKGCNSFSVESTKFCPLHQNCTSMATTTEVEDQAGNVDSQETEVMRKAELRSALRQRIFMFEDQRRK